MEIDRLSNLLLKMAGLGLTIEEIARTLNLTEKTINDKINSNEMLKEAFSINMALADLKVIKSLYKRAVGTKKKKKVTKIEDSINPKDGTLETLTKTEEVEEEVLGDVAAQKFWLSNRRPDLFSDIQIDKIKSILEN